MSGKLRISRPLRKAARLLGAHPNQGFLVRVTSGSFLVLTAGALAAFVSHLVLARTLRAEAYGIYVFAMAWMRVLFVPGKLGFESSAVRFVAQYRGLREWGLLRGFVRRAHVLVAAASCGLGLIAAAALGPLEVSPKLWLPMLIALAVLPFKSIHFVQVAMLGGLKRVVVGLATRDLLAPALLVALVVLFPPGAAEALAFFGVATMAALALTSLLLWRNLPVEAKDAVPRYETREWIRVGLPLLLMSSFFFLLKQMDILMVGSLIGATEAGIYAAAVRVAMLLSFGLMAVNSAMGPLIAELYAKKEMAELQRLVTLGARAASIFGVAAFLGILVLGPWMLGLFGSDFRQASTALSVLTLGQVANSLAGSVGLLMTMTGHQTRAGQVLAVAVVVNALLNWLLIPIFGIVGAAVATAVSTAFWNGALVFFVWRYLGINPLVKW